MFLLLFVVCCVLGRWVGGLGLVGGCFRLLVEGGWVGVWVGGWVLPCGCGRRGCGRSQT